MYYRINDIAEELEISYDIVVGWMHRYEGPEKLHCIRSTGSNLIYIEDEELRRFIEENPDDIEEARERVRQR
jgi:hypothetical protein